MGCPQQSCYRSQAAHRITGRQEKYSRDYWRPVPLVNTTFCSSLWKYYSNTRGEHKVGQITISAQSAAPIGLLWKCYSAALLGRLQRTLLCFFCFLSCATKWQPRVRWGRGVKAISPGRHVIRPDLDGWDSRARWKREGNLIKAPLPWLV